MVLMALMLTVYGWVWLSLDRSGVARAMLWMEADVDDSVGFHPG
jgi:hypothetical protein